MKRSQMKIMIAMFVFLISLAMITTLKLTGNPVTVGSAWALFPPILAIVLALITK